MVKEYQAFTSIYMNRTQVCFLIIQRLNQRELIVLKFKFCNLVLPMRKQHKMITLSIRQGSQV